MKKLQAFISLSIITFLFTGFSCNEVLDIPGLRGYFWTNSDPDIAHRLFINDVYKGILPYIPDSAVSRNHNIVKEKGLNVSLKPGKYDTHVRDSQENLISKGELGLKFAKGSVDIKSSWNNSKCHVDITYDK